MITHVNHNCKYMEDILSIISLLLVAVIPVIQKSMKKKQEKRRQSMVKRPANEVNASTQYISRNTETGQDNVSSFDETIVIETEQKRPNVVEVPRPSLVASISEPIPQHNDVSTFPPEATETDVADDFDLRKAILYSEILNPKF